MNWLKKLYNSTKSKFKSKGKGKDKGKGKAKAEDKGKGKAVEQEGSITSKRIRLEDILKQTLDWDNRCFVAAGRSGRVYRAASFHGYPDVAFKRVVQEPLNREFRNERFFLGDQHHENIVGFRGDCTENDEKILVLEYIPNGTLFDRLQGQKRKVLDWETRMRVALGAARAINHIHRAIPWAIIHRDIKSTHILLDEMDNAKLIDFGHAVFELKREPTDNVAGTEPYLAPECKRNLFTKYSDIYSFGVVLLEIITGRKPLQDGVRITDWVNRKLVNANLANLDAGIVRRMVDKKIRKTVEPQDMTRLMKLATDCTHAELQYRPLAHKVVSRLLQISCLTTAPGSSGGAGGSKSPGSSGGAGGSKSPGSSGGAGGSKSPVSSPLGSPLRSPINSPLATIIE